MSKLISDEEIDKAIQDSPKGKSLIKWWSGDPELRAIAKAQRESSDREWIEMLNDSVYSIACAGLPKLAEIHFKMPLNKWQAVKEKEA